jgi:hypothetical protein
MPDFNTIQKELQDAREEHKNIHDEFTRQKARLRSIEDQLDAVNRLTNGDDQRSDLKARLERERTAANQNLASSYEKVKSSIDKDRAILDRFSELADPSSMVEQLSDNIPFLLFPVRLETRFKQIANADELWIRIYPDDCLVDTFQELLTKSELEAAKKFWSAMWKSGGIEQQQRAAWRDLVSGFGSGRATWIYQQYKPLNLSSLPSKSKPQDVILTISTVTALPDADADAATDFWTSVWLADGDSKKEQDAFAALSTARGPAPAENILVNYKPVNIAEAPLTPFKRSEVQVNVAFVVLPDDTTIETNTSSWTQSPKASLLPDRFVVMGFKNGNQVFSKTGRPIPSSLDLGPDPSLPKEDQLQSLPDGNLQLNEGLKWMTDFGLAINKGMGLKVFQQDLSSGNLIEGFDKIIVLGLRLSATAINSKTQLEKLLQNHHYSKRGFGLLPQGTPTNNTEEDSGFTRRENADESYDIVFNKKDAFTESNDPWQKRDGQWLAEYLGLDVEFFKQIPNAGGNDQGEGRAMNTALWPATLGNFMDEMMDTVFSDDDIVKTRNFFNSYVSGRGAIPGIRIGKQPYGILPSTVFSRMDFGRDQNVTRLYNEMRKLDTPWAEMSKNVANVSVKSPKPHQQVLDVVALQASSVEFHQRYAESVDHIFDQAKLIFAYNDPVDIARTVREKGQTLLKNWGIDTKKDLKILTRLFLSKQNLLSGDLVDDTPLSEKARIRAYAASGKNYIEWLATESFDDIVRENFGGNASPSALLYLMLRHAMMEQHNLTGRQLYQERGVFADAKAAMREPDLLFVSEKETGTSKLKYLYEPEIKITKKAGFSVADFIHTELRNDFSFVNYYLSEVVKALDFFKDVPTARLERAFTEHVDCCGYRFDAWMLGFAHYRLEQQNFARQPNAAVANANSGGLYIGAYGYLENVKSERKALSPVRLTEKLEKVFNDSPDLPLLTRDSTNAGYIHAPSINQATTAAILKNAYIANANEKDKNPFGINLSSERVRLASYMLEGVRNGQSLSALLGYRFERGLHDKHLLGKGEVDVLIYPLRMIFPLIAQKIKPESPVPPGNEPQSIEQLESRNVLDGLKLINHIKNSKNKNYPFDLPVGTGPGKVHKATIAQTAAVTEEVNALLDIHDAIGDMVLSESVYQAVMGNYEGAAANTDALGKGGYPPETEVILTPRSGITLTHRVTIHFDANAAAAVTDTPRAKAEPAVNSWLRTILPLATKVACSVEFKLPSAALPAVVVITQKQLGLDAIDLLYLLDMDTEQAMNELDDRITGFVHANNANDPGAVIKVLYTKKIPGSITFFELASLLKSLRKVVVPSRHLKASDLALPLDKGLNDGFMDDVELKARINSTKDQLKLFLLSIQNAINDVISPTDSYAASVKKLLSDIAMYGLPQTGSGFIPDTIHGIYNSVINKLSVVQTRLEAKLAEYDTILIDYPAQTTNDKRFALLQAAERVISTKSTSLLPADPNIFQTDLNTFKLNTFGSTLNKIKKFKTAAVSTLKDFLDLVEPVVKNELSLIDHEFFDTRRQKNDIDEERKRHDDFRTDLGLKLKQLQTDLNKRIAVVEESFIAIDKEKSNAEKIKRLLVASKEILSEDFHLVPKFKLSLDQGDEISNAVGDSNALLTFLNTKKKFPVEDWMHGVARVREKIQHIENISFLTEALGTTEPELVPLQLPYQANDTWLAMDYDKTYTVSGDKLLYTAHFATNFAKNDSQCGILVDEWVEILPAEKENTGITFHFDQPNTEAPQALLLVTPPQFKGSWQWKDLTDAIQETFLLAQKRGVDPDLIAKSDYAQLLPAVMMSATKYMITLSTNLAANNTVSNK